MDYPVYRLQVKDPRNQWVSNPVTLTEISPDIFDRQCEYLKSLGMVVLVLEAITYNDTLH